MVGKLVAMGIWRRKGRFGIGESDMLREDLCGQNGVRFVDLYTWRLRLGFCKTIHSHLLSSLNYIFRPELNVHISILPFALFLSTSFILLHNIK